MNLEERRSVLNQVERTTALEGHVVLDKGVESARKLEAWEDDGALVVAGGVPWVNLETAHSARQKARAPSGSIEHCRTEGAGTGRAWSVIWSALSVATLAAEPRR